MGNKTTLETLKNEALAAQRRSYSPYSGFKVGAAIRTADGKIHTGCNVENSSYGATVCAERVAVQKAVSEGSHGLVEVMVVTDASPPWPPCGMCRQVIAEFGTPETAIHVANPKGEMKSYRMKELFPEAFTPEHLKK